jgi:hypothetical protein
VYQAHAHACLKMATQTTNEEDAAALLTVAEAWLRLAVEADEMPALGADSNAPSTSTRQ